MQTVKSTPFSPLSNGIVEKISLATREILLLNTNILVEIFT
jgi:hypothetical protein